MAEYVIDIDEKMYEDCKVRNTGHYSLYDFSSMITNAKPLEKLLETKCDQAFYDGYKEATEQANSIIKDIKAEIQEKFGSLTICEWEENYDFEENDISEYRYVSEVKEILALIDKHISGKERVNGRVYR